MYVLLEFCMQKLQGVKVLLEGGPKPSGHSDVEVWWTSLNQYVLIVQTCRVLVLGGGMVFASSINIYLVRSGALMGIPALVSHQGCIGITLCWCTWVYNEDFTFFLIQVGYGNLRIYLFCIAYEFIYHPKAFISRWNDRTINMELGCYWPEIMTHVYKDPLILWYPPK